MFGSLLPALLALGLAAAGCAPFDIGDQRTTPAAFELPARPTVVVVEPLSDRPSDVAFARQVAARATAQLQANTETVPAEVIDEGRVAALQDADPDAFAALSIDAIGRAVDAEVVVYAQITSTELNRQAMLLQPKASGRARVIDALTGKRLWPRPEAPSVAGKNPSHPFAADEGHASDDSAGTSRTADDRARRALADQAGLQLARLFYPWQRLAPGERVAAEKAKYQRSKR